MARKTSAMWDEDPWDFDEEVNSQTRSALGIADPDGTDEGFGSDIDPIPREDLPPIEEPVIDSGVGTKYWEPTPGAEGGVTDGSAVIGGAAASTFGNAMPGWDTAKWSDPAHTTPKYVVGRILSKYPTTVAGLTSALPEIQAAYPGATFNGKDIVSIPGVGDVDVLQNASTGGTGFQWLTGGDATGGVGTGALTTDLTGGLTGTAGAGAAAAATGTTTAGTEAGAGGDAFSEAIRQRILALLAGSEEPITAESPNLAPAAKAFRLAQERGAQLQREKLAERMAAQGLGDSGAMDAGIAGIYQQQGQDVAGFESQLVLNELTARREEVANALQTGAGLVSADQEAALRRELAALDAQIRREGIGAQTQLGLSELELRRLIAEMQNQQFNDQLGFNIGDREAYWNAYGLGLGS